MKQNIIGDVRPLPEFNKCGVNTLLGLDALGLHAVSQRHVKRGARSGAWQIRCHFLHLSGDCKKCGQHARIRNSWWRTFVHTPIAMNAVHLFVRFHRYEYQDCGCLWSDDCSQIAPEGKKLTHRAVWWAVASVVLDARSVRSVAQTLYCSWGCANKTVLDTGLEYLIHDTHRLDGVTTIGVDEHVWRHTSKGDRYVTVIVDLTPRQHGKPARLLDMVEGRSEKVFATWLEKQCQSFRDGIRVVAMDAFAGHKKAASRVVPHAVEVLGPFHIVALVGEKVTTVRCRLQQETTGRRGTKHDPLYRGRRALLKTAGLRTDRQQERVDHLLAIESNAPLKLIHGVYQKIISCYKQKDRKKGRGMMAELIESLAIPGAIKNCPELKTLGHTLKRRMKDILAFLDHQYSANGPTEAINGRLEHLRGIALGFRTLNNYITRSLQHAGGFKQTIHTKM
ncbi:MAG: ISL3 family transposase [Bifidobacterium sp.]